MHIPQEIQDNIIDFLVGNLPRETRKASFNLRLVCRAWIPRVNFHVFRSLRMEIAQCPTLLSVVKSSHFAIGLCIRHLLVYSGDTNGDRTLFPYHNDQAALQEYLAELAKSLPYLEFLKLEELFPDQVTWIPCFPTIKSLTLWDVLIWPSQLIRLISTPTSLEILGGCASILPEEGNIGFSSPPPLSPSSVCLKNLKSYEAWLVVNHNTRSLEYYLFPFAIQPNLPSLTLLNLRGIHPETMTMAIHLLHPVSQSLRFLQLSFRRAYEQDEQDGGTQNTLLS